MTEVHQFKSALDTFEYTNGVYNHTIAPGIWTYIDVDELNFEHLVDIVSKTHGTKIYVANQENFFKKFEIEIGANLGSIVSVEDSLASSSTTSALSVNQGKVLKDEIDTKCPLVEGKVPSANLPSYVDDVLEYANFASFPVTGEAGKIYVDTSTDFVYRWSGSAYFQLGSSGGGSGIREDVTFTSGSIVANASVSGTVSISPRYQLLQITTNYPCRVCLYTSTAKRDADITRPIGTDPTGNHGLLFEFISSTELLSADLSPLVDGFADTASIPYSLTNLSGATQTISVMLNHVKTGA